MMEICQVKFLRKFGLFTAMALISASAAHAATDLLPAAPAWKVWTSDGPAPQNWEQPGFDDSAWETIQAPLVFNGPHWLKGRDGYNSIKKRATTYARITFEAKALDKEVLEVALLAHISRAFGVALYLNGTPVDVRRLPEGFVHETRGQGSRRMTRMTTRGIDPGLVRTGKNVLALTLHLQNPKYKHYTKFDLQLTALTGGDNRFVSGPVVAGVYQRKAVITVAPLFKSTVIVRYGKKGSDKNMVLKRAEGTDLHTLEIGDLEPDTVYVYDLEVTRVGGREKLTYAAGEFRTAPEGPREFTFGVYGDNRARPQAWAKVAGAMVSDKSLEFVVGLGDFVSEGDVYEDWETQFFAPGRGFLASTPFWAIVGNHDYITGSSPRVSSYYKKIFGQQEKIWYTFTYGNVRFLCLNTLSITREQVAFTEKTLSEATEPYVFVMAHNPIYASGFHGNLDASGKPKEHGGRMVYEQLLPLFEKHKISTFFAAHSHLYDRSEKDGITHVTTGGGGVGLARIQKGLNPYSKRAVATFHYCRIRITPDKAIVEAVNVAGAGANLRSWMQRPEIEGDGTVFDRYEITPRK